MFSDKVILITGASRGLGRSTAAHLAKLKCNLALCARAPQLSTVPWFEELPEKKRLYASVDLRNPHEIQQFVEQVKLKFGRLDVLINNAAIIGPSGPSADAPLDEWLSAINTNICGSLAMLKFCMPILRQNHGCAIQIISSAGFVPIAHFGPYCVTKSAQIMMMRTIGAEESNIMALCYDPSMMDTDMQRTIRTDIVPDLPQPYQKMFTQAYDNNLVMDIESAGRTLAWQALHPSPNQQGAIINGADPQMRQTAQKWWNYVTQ